VHPLRILVEAYSLVVLVSILGSWVGSRHAIFEFADRLTEPVLGPIRKVLPPAGGFDLSPVVLLILLHVVSAMLM
jgi:YggT family protein